MPSDNVVVLERTNVSFAQQTKLPGKEKPKRIGRQTWTSTMSEWTCPLYIPDYYGDNVVSEYVTKNVLIEFTKQTKSASKLVHRKQKRYLYSGGSQCVESCCTRPVLEPRTMNQRLSPIGSSAFHWERVVTQQRCLWTIRRCCCNGSSFLSPSSYVVADLRSIYYFIVCPSVFPHFVFMKVHTGSCY